MRIEIFIPAPVGHRFVEIAIINKGSVSLNTRTYHSIFMTFPITQDIGYTGILGGNQFCNPCALTVQGGHHLEMTIIFKTPPGISVFMGFTQTLHKRIVSELFV